MVNLTSGVQEHIACDLLVRQTGRRARKLDLGANADDRLHRTGDRLQASRAAQIGLINRAVPAADLDQSVQSFAQKLERGAQQAVRWTKASVNLALKQQLGSVFESARAYEVIASTLPDHAEAVQAFAEGRKPDFSRKF